MFLEKLSRLVFYTIYGSCWEHQYLYIKIKCKQQCFNFLEDLVFGYFIYYHKWQHISFKLFIFWVIKDCA